MLFAPVIENMEIYASNRTINWTAPWYCHVPNLISLTRLITAIPAAVFLHFGFNTAFVLLMLFQMFGDKADGMLARRWRAETLIGRKFDTTADLLFFGSVGSIIFLNPAWLPLGLLFLPGVLLGAFVVMSGMAHNAEYSFPRRPIDHVSFVLYAALASLVYLPFWITSIITVIGASLIFISSILLAVRRT